MGIFRCDIELIHMEETVKLNPSNIWKTLGRFRALVQNLVPSEISLIIIMLLTYIME